MNERVTVILPMQLRRYLQQTVLEVGCDPPALLELCVGLCLLKERLISTLVLEDRGGRVKAAIQVADGARRGGGARATGEGEGRRIVLSQTALEYVMSFVLKYARDGMAEVDHVDLDVDADDPGEAFTLTLSATRSTPPVSAEEARRRLGLA
ncbi:MAG: hypothetical protein LW650_12055 [Planctomycetaceae bacterium]|jgi:hypothetical protein|nr:hypothetical protein [Phycisphaerales bacterium]MCE2654159.1 hypothetical protein [Planctomycetaceae bacterium]